MRLSVVKNSQEVVKTLGQSSVNKKIQTLDGTTYSLQGQSFTFQSEAHKEAAFKIALNLAIESGQDLVKLFTIREEKLLDKYPELVKAGFINLEKVSREKKDGSTLYRLIKSEGFVSSDIEVLQTSGFTLHAPILEGVEVRGFFVELPKVS